MKYESDILKRLIDTYGVVGNPQYMSEIIKEFIVQGKECFPNLFTYQSDWLAHIDEFGLKPSYTVSYTGQSIYAPNTLEKPVKSAILKGQTLVNVFNKTGYTSDNRPYLTLKGNFINVAPSELYTIKFFNAPISKVRQFRVVERHKPFVDTIYASFNDTFKFTTTNDFTNFEDLIIQVVETSSGIITDEELANIKVVLIKGDYTNADIPYFEGMQSVKMPVLTTSNEDGTKTNILMVNEDVTLRGVGDVQDTLDCLTGEVTERIGEIVLDGSEYITIGTNNVESYETIQFFINNVYQNGLVNHKQISDRMCYYYNNDDNEHFYVSGTRVIVFVKKSKLVTQDVDGFKQWLSQNPITVQYQLATESIKTVDLSILDQNGQNVKQLMSFSGGTHFITRSSEGSPLPTVSVSVETDLTETLKVCSLEGNTM